MIFLMFLLSSTLITYLTVWSNEPSFEYYQSSTHLLSNHHSIDVSSLIDVKSALLAGGRHFAWFELGLALGLYYGTLKVIQSEYSKDDEYLRDTLAAWLEQKDRVPQQGVPSWHSLTRALAHPLVSQQGLAHEIARKHPKVILSMVVLINYGNYSEPTRINRTLYRLKMLSIFYIETLPGT